MAKKNVHDGLLLEPKSEAQHIPQTRVADAVYGA